MKKLLFLSLFLPFMAMAQSLPTGNSSAEAPDTKSSGNSKRKNQTVDFEDELIQGEVNKPELFYLLQQKQFNFKRLIKLREDFLPEMRRTSEEIKRGGGAN